MVPEAPLERTEIGFVPAGEGWFVLNVRDARWERDSTFGDFCEFESDHVSFPSFGANIHVIEPGQPSCMYHGESSQEAFLVLSGECLLIVEGEERPLRQWDFFYAAPYTRHVFVGAGGGPCAILMMGARDPDEQIVYPVDEVALRHGAGVERETPVPREAYAPFDRTVTEIEPRLDALP
jgi:uncharacterized cupin superfamily protein